MSNVLVTGGCGFIGSHLVDKLTEDKNNVFVIDDLSTGLKDNCNSSANYIFKDLVEILDSSEQFSKLIIENQIDTVFHLAALADVRESIKEPLKVYTVNTLVTIKLAELCSELGVEKFIFSSTSAVYGEPHYLPVDEDHPVNPLSPYGLSKLSAERYLDYKANSSDMSVIIFRFPNVYGPRQRSDLEGGVISIFKDKMENNDELFFYGDGKQTRDWVHCFDIVEALDCALKSECKNVVLSLGSNVQKSLLDLFKLMSKNYGYKLEPIHLSARKGDIKDMLMANKRTKKILGWEPKISLAEGIKIS